MQDLTFVRLCEWNVSENPGDEFRVSVFGDEPRREQEAQLGTLRLASGFNRPAKVLKEERRNILAVTPVM